MGDEKEGRKRGQRTRMKKKEEWNNNRKEEIRKEKWENKVIGQAPANIFLSAYFRVH